jgi:hypothetical protein
MNDPNDPDYRELIWQEFQAWHPHLMPSTKYLDDHPEWWDVVIDAEIERRRIGMIQRENHGRMYRGEPLIEPQGASVAHPWPTSQPEG